MSSVREAPRNADRGPAGPRRKLETMLLLALIGLCWLVVLALGVVLCRTAARADDALARERERSIPGSLPTGIGLWPDPQDLGARDLRPVAERRIADSRTRAGAGAHV
jgi:hypothetical protein